MLDLRGVLHDVEGACTVTKYTEKQLDRILSQLQSVPGIRTLRFKEGYGYPHFLVIRSEMTYFFYCYPKGYKPEPGETDYHYWFPTGRVGIVSGAHDILEAINLHVRPGTIQIFKKSRFWISGT
jgi:hypothetical protein